MTAKTIFLNDLNEIIIYEAKLHSDNHANYMGKYYSNLKITEYIPILLTKYNHCVIDLSELYLIGIIYLPTEISTFQKDFLNSQKLTLQKYNIYLNDCLQEGPMSFTELLNVINESPTLQKEKKLVK